MLAAGGALAADKKMKPSISVNGFYSAHASVIVDEKLDTAELNPPAVDFRDNSEVHFNGSATLDNGTKIAVRWELEGSSHTSGGKPSPANGNDQIDQVYVTVSGSFGKIVLGSSANAPMQMLTGMSGAWATNVGQNFQFNSQEWIPSAAGTRAGRFHVLQDERIREHGGGGAAEKITYISPNFGGFQVGASYIPYAEQDHHVTHNVDEGRHDGGAGAISYNGKFGDVGIAVGAGVSIMQGAEDDENLSEWLVAGRLDFGGGFRVAVAHQRTTSGVTGPLDLEGSLTTAGVRYTVGANSFSLVGSYGELANTQATYTAAKAAYKRTLGSGVSMDVNLFVNQSQSDDGEQENSGVVLTSGISVAF